MGIFVIAGQSNCCNSVDALYTPAHPDAIDNLNVYDGGMYAASDPLLGCFIGPNPLTGGNIFLRVADNLITAGKYDRIVLVPVGVGGSSIVHWAPGGAMNSRLLVAHRRLLANGLVATANIWMQGESDQGMSQGVYSGHLATVIATPRADGFNAPWLVGRCSYIYGVAAPAVQATQIAAVNGVDVFAGADTDTLTASSRQADNAHFNSVGAAAAALLWTDAIRVAL